MNARCRKCDKGYQMRAKKHNILQMRNLFSPLRVNCRRFSLLKRLPLYLISRSLPPSLGMGIAIKWGFKYGHFLLDDCTEPDVRKRVFRLRCGAVGATPRIVAALRLPED